MTVPHFAHDLDLGTPKTGSNPHPKRDRGHRPDPPKLPSNPPKRGAGDGPVLYGTGSICVCRHGIDTDDCGAWDCVNRPLVADEGGTA